MTTVKAEKQETVEVKHLDGCPRNEGRIESFGRERPSGQPVVITRCGDCGAQEVRNA